MLSEAPEAVDWSDCECVRPAQKQHGPCKLENRPDAATRCICDQEPIASSLQVLLVLAECATMHAVTCSQGIS